MNNIENVVIDFEVGSLKYHVVLNSKITLIKGHSGRGKSYFVDKLEEYLNTSLKSNDELQANMSLSVSNNYEIVILPTIFGGVVPSNYDSYVETLSNAEYRSFSRALSARVIDELQNLANSRNIKYPNRIIFISDEDSVYIDSHFFQRAVNSLPYLFLFVNRDPIFGTPYGVDSVTAFETIDNVSTNTAYFRDINRFRRSDYSNVFIEDKMAGFQFFKQMIQQDLDFLGSKDNILKFWNQYTNALFILDGLGCGATLDRLHNYILAQETHNQNDVYLIGSFEHMLLTSEFAKRGNAKSGFVLREPAINEWNVEEFYAKELSRFCVEALKMRMGYHKKDLASCFVEACKSSVKDCKGLLDFTQSSCDYRIPGTLQDKLKNLVPEDLYQILINLKGDSKLTCNQSQDSAKLSEQPDTNSGKTNSKDSESDIITNLFG